MDTNTANQLSSEFESAIAEVLPALTSLIQRYQVLGVLAIKLDLVSGVLMIELESGSPPFQCTIDSNGLPHCHMIPDAQPVP